jgi:transposase
MRAEFWERRAAAIRECASRGLDENATAESLGMVVQTVRRYANKYGIVFVSVSDQRLEALRGYAALGTSQKDAAALLGVSRAFVCKAAKEHDLQFDHGLRKGPDERSRAMAAMFRSGKTMEAISQIYGISRERVRQIIKARHGIVGTDGGARTTKEIKIGAKRAKREAACFRRYGCSLTEYHDLLAVGLKMKRSGVSNNRTPCGAFRTQKKNAKMRGIAWRLSLTQWWGVWEASGHWDYRGRDGYVMCRFGDNGAYEQGNVYIATAHHNLTVQPNNPYRIGHPDHAAAVARLRAAKTSGIAA